jgi:hypothetical protein
LSKRAKQFSPFISIKISYEMHIKGLFILLLLSTATVWGQDVKNMENSTGQNPECESAREKATADFKKGIRKIYVFGLLPDFKYMRILDEKYDIKAVSGGCAVTSELKCYSDCMEELITQEKGFGFFQRVKLEVSSSKPQNGMF